MTEKRFKFDDGTIWERGYESWFEIFPSKAVDLLNELNNNNEQLKKDKTNLHRAMSRDRVKYNQFKDKVFCCIDMKINLLKDCFMSNEVKILEDLKKEICDLE